MLIGSVLEKMDAECAWQLCADKLADSVRNSWQKNTAGRVSKWEDAFSEDVTALAGLREEGFTNLVGLDYIFKWWGAKDDEELAGQVDVVWKVASDEGVSTYHSWIKLAERDFILGRYREERAKRDANRAAFRDAFAQWRKLFEQI
ncbi:MAG: hypothetical protein LJU34_05135 [Oscillospiraceae bacterium]|nr:hypothetical protein [Oscillospiraceae bacterium]